ncbi:MAG TPA: Gfo/Idh/MocA family oxidoreductase [Ktedonobacteraceae bacterium]|jgi:predicted dehydrogenase
MRIKIAVVGAGSMGANHLRVLGDLPAEQVHLVGVAEVSAPTLAAAVGRFHVAGYRDYRQLIARTDPDLLAVAVPTHLHFTVAAYALERGIHVLLEKPIAGTIAEAQALIALARRSGVLLAIGHIERFNPAIVQLRRRLRAGELGAIFQLHARRLGPFPPRIRDVGVTLDLATHDIDIMRHLVAAEVAHLYGQTQRRIHRTREDCVFGILRFTNGIVGMLDVNWLTPTKVRELSVTGERGMFQVNYLTQDLYFYENDYSPTTWDALRSLTGVSEGTMTRLKVQKAEPLRLEYEDVLAAIGEARSPTVSGEDGLAALTIAQRLLASAAAEEQCRREAGVPNGQV